MICSNFRLWLMRYCLTERQFDNNVGCLPPHLNYLCLKNFKHINLSVFNPLTIGKKHLSNIWDRNLLYQIVGSSFELIVSVLKINAFPKLLKILACDDIVIPWARGSYRDTHGTIDRVEPRLEIISFSAITRLKWASC